MDAVEAGKEIRRAVDTGKVLFGTKECIYSIKHGEGKLLVLSKTIIPTQGETLTYLAGLAEIPLYPYEGTGQELGNVCGKPYVVSALLVMQPGKSKIKELGEIPPIPRETR